MKKGNDGNQLKFVQVGKPNDEEHNLRKIKSNIAESKNANAIMVGSEITTNKTSNSEQLLDSIIQSRCLTKDQERVTSGSLRPIKDNQESSDYCDSKMILEKRPEKLIQRDSKLRKSITSNQERENDKLSKNDISEGKQQKDTAEDA